MALMLQYIMIFKCL